MAITYLLAVVFSGEKNYIFRQDATRNHKLVPWRIEFGTIFKLNFRCITIKMVVLSVRLPPTRFYKYHQTDVLLPLDGGSTTI